MGLASAIIATQMAGGEFTSQALADLAKQIWDDWRRALNAGRVDDAAELEKDFAAVCEIFQGEKP